MWRILLLLPLGWLAGCRTAPPPTELHRYELSSPHMGTLFRITLFAPSPAAAEAAAREAFQRVAALEDIMSDYQADSELMLLAGQPWGRPVSVSEDLFQVLQRAQDFAARSRGAFDVTMGPYVRLWRFARKRKRLPAAAELASASRSVGFQHLRLDSRQRAATLLAPGMRLDLGGIAKGYAADEALKILRRHGLPRALVAASGDLALGDPPPGARGWKVGIAALEERGAERLERVIELCNAGISTSGGTEQFIEIDGRRYSHILDPRTGLGLTNRIQATVIAANATTTDAMATAVCVLGPARGLQMIDSLPGAAAVVLTREANGGRICLSRRAERRLGAAPAGSARTDSAP